MPYRPPSTEDEAKVNRRQALASLNLGDAAEYEAPVLATLSRAKTPPAP